MYNICFPLSWIPEIRTLHVKTVILERRHIKPQTSFTLEYDWPVSRSESSCQVEKVEKMKLLGVTSRTRYHSGYKRSRNRIVTC